MTKKYDLHCHSTASDGVLTPTELVQRAHEKGVNVLALCDHDTVMGIDEAKIEADKLGLKSHSESMKFLESMGIKTTGIFELLETSKDIEKRIDYWEKERENLPYETFISISFYTLGTDIMPNCRLNFWLFSSIGYTKEESYNT